MDEQIFAIQQYGGISRLFFELAKQFTTSPGLGVELNPLDAPIVNRYVLEDPQLAVALEASSAKSNFTALAHYFSRRTNVHDADIVHNTFYLPNGLAGAKTAKKVVTIYDMIPELLPKTRRRLDLLTMKRHYVRQADHIICISAATRGDLVRLYPEITAPITVVHLGVDPLFAPGIPRWKDLPDNYVLFVGNRGQYKDAEVLLRAFTQFRRQYPDVTLLFVGGGLFTSKENRLIASLGISSQTLQRSLPDKEMSSAYGNAFFTVFPSRFEGFGLPVLESMACGTATLLADATSLPEVGGDAALYFSSGDVAELAERMLELAGDTPLREEKGMAGILQASKFSWERCAQETADVYAATLSQ